MTQLHDPNLPRVATGRRPSGDDRWDRLVRCETAADAIAEAASWVAGDLLALALIDGAGQTVAAWGIDPDDASGCVERSTPLGGRSGMRLCAWFDPRGGARRADASLVPAVMAIDAWRATHAERERLEARLARRTRELDLIQTLGRRAAEATTPFELFRSAVSVLHQGEEIDLVVVAHALDGDREAPLFVSRPVAPGVVTDVVRRAGGLLGWPADALPTPSVHRLDSYADDAGSRRAIDDHELVVLPIVRRRTNVACLLVVPSGPDGDGALRLLYSATNKLAIHLDRIMAMREAEADRFRSILDSMPQAVQLVDRHLRVQLVNRSAERMFERGGPPLSGDLSPAVARYGLGDPVTRVREGLADVEDAEIVIEGDRTVHVTVSPLSRGPAGGLVLVWSDVTESRRLQRRLAQSEKMSSLGQMISGVAHELNNPLASILGYAQLLRKSSSDEAVHARLDTLKSEAERCRRIVQNLLSFARRRGPERRRMSLNEVVQSVVQLMAYQLRVDGVRVETALAHDVPSLTGDPHALQQVLVNLLTNARHAIGSGGGVVTIRTLADGDHVAIDVIDDGPGVPEAIRHAIFDPFFTTKPEGKGTGLGLALVYTIVDDHGGSIDLLDGPDRTGAHFRVRLPIANAAPAPSPSAGAQPSPPAAGRAGRVLVVDDEEPLARMMCDALVAAGYRADAVHDATRALERLGSTRYDVVISDVRMPGMDGERLVDAVRRQRPELAGRLVLTTGDTVSDDVERLGRRTGLPVLHKPFDLDELQRLVATRLADAGDGER